MFRKLKTWFMVCAVLLGFGLLMPVKDVSAATATDQIRVDNQKKTVTVDFNSFSNVGYNYTVISKSNPTTPVIPETAATKVEGSDLKHLTFSTASLPVGYYRVTITAPDSTTKITKDFHTYGNITSAVYANATYLLNWTDTNNANATQYRIRFYNSASDVSNPSGYVYQKYSKGNAQNFTLSANYSGKTYYVTITPFTKGADNIAYFGGSYATSISVIKAPTSVKVTAGYKSAVVKWSKVTGAASYVVKNLTTGAKVTVANTKTQVTISGLTEKKTYKFCVYSKLGKSTSARSTAVNATIPKTVSGKVSGLQMYGYNGYLYITWNSVSGADGYKVYYKKTSASSYTTLGSTTSTTYKTAKVKLNASCTFLVKPYTLINGSKIDQSAQNATVTGNPYKLLTEMATVRTIGYLSKTTRKTNLYNTYTSKTVAKTLSTGAKVEQLDAVNTKYNRCKVLYNNRTYYCNRDYIKSYASNYTTKKYYSTAVKESFVKNYSSSTKYLIWISQYTQQVSIFKGSKGNWKLVKSFICATGKHTTRSARGQFKITKKEKGWYYSSTYEEYITHFYLRNSFHTRIHRYGGGYSDATIGKPASNGCVRLYDSDAKYIYQNMPKNTTVVSY